MTFDRQSHLVEESFWNGRGVIECSSFWSNASKSFLYSSLQMVLLLNHDGISVRIWPSLKGIFSNACSTQRAKLWQLHLNKTQSGLTFFSLENRLFFAPTIEFVVSTPKPTQSSKETSAFLLFLEEPRTVLLLLPEWGWLSLQKPLWFSGGLQRSIWQAHTCPQAQEMHLRWAKNYKWINRTIL